MKIRAQGEGYARDLWRERHRDLETLESERLDMSASDYQSCRCSLLQAIDELEALLREPEVESSANATFSVTQRAGFADPSCLAQFFARSIVGRKINRH